MIVSSRHNVCDSCIMHEMLITMTMFLQYGKDYTFDTPVKLLDKLLYSVAQSEDEQLVVISQVQLSKVMYKAMNEYMNLCFTYKKAIQRDQLKHCL